MSAGTVRAEEFNSVLENMPAVAKAMADQFRVTTGQLRQLVLAGAVDLVDAFNAILQPLKKSKSNMHKMPMTIGRAFCAASKRVPEFC